MQGFYLCGFFFILWFFDRSMRIFLKMRIFPYLWFLEGYEDFLDILVVFWIKLSTSGKILSISPNIYILFKILQKFIFLSNKNIHVFSLVGSNPLMVSVFILAFFQDPSTISYNLPLIKRLRRFIANFYCGNLRIFHVKWGFFCPDLLSFALKNLTSYF